MEYLNDDIVWVIGGFLRTPDLVRATEVCVLWHSALAPHLALVPRTVLDLVQKYPEKPWNRIYLGDNKLIPFEHAIQFNLTPHRDDVPVDYLIAHADQFGPEFVAEYAPISYILEKGISIPSVALNRGLTPAVLRANPQLRVNLSICPNAEFNDTNIVEFARYYQTKITHPRKFSAECIKKYHYTFDLTVCYHSELSHVSVDDLLAIGVPPDYLCPRSDFTAEHVDKYLDQVVRNDLLELNPNLTRAAIDRLLSANFSLCDCPTAPQELRVRGKKHYAGANTTMEYVLSTGPWDKYTVTKHLGTVENVRAHPLLHWWNWGKLSQSLPFWFIYQNPQMRWVYERLSRNDSIPEWYIHDTIDHGWDFDWLSLGPE